MKKFFLSPLFFVAFAGVLIAQPTLQNTVFPQIGDVSVTVTADSNVISEGGAGANQTWNFTALQPADSAQTSVYVDDNATPADLDMAFPDANLAAKYVFGNDAYYTFLRSTNTELSILGSGNTGVIPLTYTDPEIVLRTPLSFNGSFSDNFASTRPYPDASLTTRGAKTTTYDAYGTLMMPGGTFNNVIRLKSTTQEMDTVSLFAGFSVSSTTITTYEWFVNSRRSPLVTILYSQGTSTFFFPGIPPTPTEIPLTKSISYVTSTTDVDEPNWQAGWSVALAGANPARDELRLSVSTEQARSQMRVSIVDVQGKLMQTETVDLSSGVNTLHFPIATLPAGAYFIQLHDGKVGQTLAWQKQ